MLENITKREKLLGLVTIGVVLIVSIYNFTIEPLAKQWDSLNNEVRDKEVLLRKHSRISYSKDAIEKLYTEYTGYFRKEDLTPEEESAIALSNIEKLARGANAHITNIKPLTIKSFENYNIFTYRVATESRIGELTKFIYDLQSSEQLLKVERMVLRAKEREHDIIKAILHITKVSVF